MDKKYYALTFVNKDKKGIVAATTKVLLDNGFNLLDSSSTRLQGIFAMVFIVTNEKSYSESQIKDMFKDIPTHMEVFKFNKEKEVQDGTHYHISIHGADKVGIVHTITRHIADNDLNILDLHTFITGDNQDIYIMALEVVSTNDDDTLWHNSLKEVAKSIDTQINIKKIEVFEF